MSTLILKDTLVVLPSQGRVYEGIELPAQDCVRVRPFVAADQKIFGGSGQDLYRIYYNMMSRLIIEPEKLSPDILLWSDVNVVLFAARIMAHGPEHRYTYPCSNCNSKEQGMQLLNELEVMYADDKEDFSMTREVELSNNDQVLIALPTLADERRVQRTLEGMRKRQAEIEDYNMERAYLRIATQIQQINGEDKKSAEMNLRYVNEMPAGDFYKLSDVLIDMDVGLQLDIEVRCTVCGWLNDVRLRPDIDFFRPQRKGRR